MDSHMDEEGIMANSGSDTPPTSSVDGIRTNMRKGTHSCLECRKRKIRCMPSEELPSMCVPCLERGSRCLGQEIASVSMLKKTKTVRQRLAFLESTIETLLEERNDRRSSDQQRNQIGNQRPQMIDTNTFATKKSKNELPPISSLFDNPIWYRIQGNLSPLPDSDPPQIHNPQECSSTNTSPSEPTLRNSSVASVTGDEKNRLVCQALRAALPPEAQIQEAVNKYAQPWEFIARAVNEASTVSQDLSLKHFIFQALDGDDAVALAKVVQIVATVMDITTHERLLVLVDQLVIYDDKYMETMAGLECVLFQGTLFADIGQVRRSWLAYRRGMKYMQIMGLHRTRQTLRQEVVWWQMLQGDRFSSLTLGTEYTISNAECNLQFRDTGQYTGRRRNDFIASLSILAGKVIDLIHTRSEHSYDATLAIDHELHLLASQMPADYWKVKPCTPKDHTEGMGLLSTLGGHSLYYKMKVVLHMPYMFKSAINPGYGFSRDACLDAARGLIQCLHILRASGDRFLHKHKGFHFLAFVGCIILVLGIRGYGKMDSEQSTEDWKSIVSTIELFMGLSADPSDRIAVQCYRALLQLTQFRQLASVDQDDIVQVVVPFFGTITVRRGHVLQDPVIQTPRTSSSTQTQPVQGYTPNLYQQSQPTLPIAADPVIAYQGPYMHTEIEGQYFKDTNAPQSYPTSSGLQDENDGGSLDLDQDWSWLTADMTYNSAQYPYE